MINFEIDDFNALREALHRMCQQLSAENIPEDIVFCSKLVADELLSNVLQHGGGRAFFAAAREGDEIKLCVRGIENFCPPEKSTLADVFAESGRGLFLVDAYCTRREFSEHEGILVYIKIAD